MNYSYFIAYTGVDKDSGRFGDKYNKHKSEVISIPYMLTDEKKMDILKANLLDTAFPFSEISEIIVTGLTFLHAVEGSEKETKKYID